MVAGGAANMSDVLDILLNGTARNVQREVPEQARQMGRTIGGYLRFYGFNLDFAPVRCV